MVVPELGLGMANALCRGSGSKFGAPYQIPVVGLRTPVGM